MIENPWPFATDQEAAAYFTRVRFNLPYVAHADRALLIKLSRHFDEKRSTQR